MVEHLATDAVSIGRYVLSGGELAAMVLVDAVLRKLPGALGHEESRGRGVLQRRARGRARVSALHPPGRIPGWTVPEVLLSGHHERIREWRLRAEPPRGPRR